MRSLRITWMVLLAAPWLPATSPAFPLEDHKQITLESLDAIVRPSPAGSPPGVEGVYRFTPAAAEQVANANREMDVATAGGWLTFAPSDEHFENSVAAKSARRIADLQREIVNALLLAKGTPEPILESLADEARVLLGEALHTAQDMQIQPSSDYPDARAAAVKASALLVQTILAQLESAGAQRSICAFLGRTDCGDPDAQ